MKTIKVRPGYSDEEKKLRREQAIERIPAFECVLCKNTVKQFGNNPYPLHSENSKCCDECNGNFVIPARIYNLNEEECEYMRSWFFSEFGGPLATLDNFLNEIGR